MLIPVANGSEAVEIVAIADILRRAKVDVVIASVERSVKILASQGTKIVADKLIGKAAESIYDLIILPVRQIKYLIRVLWIMNILVTTLNLCCSQFLLLTLLP